MIKVADEVKQLIDMVAGLKENMNERFDEVEERLDGVEERLDRVEERLDGFEDRFDGVDERFDKVDSRFDDVEAAIKELNTTQLKILNSIELIEKDVHSNRKHIERLENRKLFV